MKLSRPVKKLQKFSKLDIDEVQTFFDSTQSADVENVNGRDIINDFESCRKRQKAEVLGEFKRNNSSICWKPLLFIVECLIVYCTAEPCF